MIRKITESDKTAVIEMMREFYSSDAVFTNGSDEIFGRDVDCCIADDPYVEGYVFEENGALQGYAMLAKSFSTEFGRHCVWLEDIYIMEKYRGLGLAKSFLEFISRKYPDCVIRLEVEDCNERAVKVYKKAGFVNLPYDEMIKM